MDILVSTDENYLFHTCVMLRSLFAVHPKEKFTIYIMVNAVCEESVTYITRFIEKNGHKPSVINITDEDYKMIGVDVYEDEVKKSDHITMATFNRLLIIDKLPLECHRILYLDSDIIIRKSIKTFYDSSMLNVPNTPAIAVEGFSFKDLDFVLLASNSFQKENEICRFHKEYCEKTGFPTEKKFFNAGVMLFNVDYLRRIKFSQMVRNFCEVHPCFDHDQFILNMLFMDSVKWAPFIYNCRPSDFSKNNKNYLKKNVHILHYGVKPWNDKKTILGWCWWSHAFRTDLKRTFIMLLK